ncbi:hypothetical protein J437_LFUL011133 [Ladona fulva]|uniref:RNA-directed DNA polymerase n=1 Tax=Ladona fulva TaxID=123851 RepID=A0A8K0K7Q9_LADFU|nr:hypothetical protein J437_LFUL011133 [Ladona fulva]
MPLNPYEREFASTAQSRRVRMEVKSDNPGAASAETARVESLGSDPDLGCAQESTSVSQPRKMLSSIPDKDFDLVKLFVNEISAFTEVNPENLFAFLASAYKVVNLELAPLNSVLTLLVCKLPLVLRNSFLSAIRNQLTWTEITRQIWDDEISSRQFEKLVMAKAKRFQYPNERPLHFLNDIRNAIIALGLSYSDEEFLSLILNGLNPLTRSTFIFQTRPTTLDELDALLKYATKQLMDSADYAHTFSNFNHRDVFRVSCSFCNWLGHDVSTCRSRKRPVNRNKPQISMGNFESMVLNSLPLVSVCIRCVRTYALVDSGSSVSLLDPQFGKKLKIKITSDSNSILQIQSISGVKLHLVDKAKLNVKIHTMSWSHHFYLSPLPVPLLLGRDFMVKTKMILAIDYFSFVLAPSLKLHYVDSTHPVEAYGQSSHSSSEANSSRMDQVPLTGPMLVLQKLRSAGLTIHEDKIKLCQTSISFLGHCIQNGQLLVDPERVHPIVDFPVPTSIKQVVRFLGMAGFYAKFIPHFAEIANPLNKLKKKGARFFWSSEQANSFQKLKVALANPPVLTMPRFDREFHLFVDASQIALGAVLNHKINGNFTPVAYASRTLSPHEQKLPTYELECMACCWAVDKFKDYLQFKEFHLYTDNGALTWLFAHPKQLGKIGRMVLKLSTFKFVIHHVRGNNNKPADCLSRVVIPHQSHIAQGTTCFLHNIPLSFVDIREHQKNDSVLGQLFFKTSTSKNRELVIEGNVYKMKNDILCYKPPKSKKCKVVIPAALRPMHPQSNPSERIMRELSRLFRVYCAGQHTNWPEVIPHINNWLNEIPHESIGMSPYEAHFGKKPRRTYNVLPEEGEESVGEPQERNRIRQIVLNNLGRSGRKREKAQKQKTHEFKEGDRVLLKTPKVSDTKLKLFHKFFPVFSGPYVVRKIVAQNACELEEEGGGTYGIYNFWNLVPYASKGGAIVTSPNWTRLQLGDRGMEEKAGNFDHPPPRGHVSQPTVFEFVTEGEKAATVCRKWFMRPSASDYNVHSATCYPFNNDSLLEDSFTKTNVIKWLLTADNVPSPHYVSMMIDQLAGDFGDMESLPKRKYAYRYSQHLQEALSLDKLEFYSKHPNFWDQRYHAIPVDSIKLFKDGKVGRIAVLPWIRDYLVSRPSTSYVESDHDRQSIVKMVRTSLDVQGKCLNHDNPNFNNRQMHNMLDRVGNDPLVLNALRVKYLILDIHRELDLGSESIAQSFSPPCLPAVIFEGDMVFLTEFPQGGLCVPYSVFLCVMDKLEAEFSFLLFNSLNYMAEDPAVRDVTQFNLALDKRLDILSRVVGNDAAKFNKTLGPQFLGLTLLTKDA